MQVEKKCQNCNRPFKVYPYRKNDAKFCSYECYWKSRYGKFKSKVPCHRCGKEVIKSPSAISKHTFCSKECRYAWHSESFSKQNSSCWNSKLIPCTHCGKKLYRNQFKLTKNLHNFCSKKCYSSWMIRGKKIKCATCEKELYKERGRLKERNFCSKKCQGKFYSGENNHQWNRITLVCEHCEKSYEVSLCRKASRFCTFKCYNNWRKERRNQDNRGANWREQKKLALIRDKFSCRICGLSENLVVHHIVPFSSFKSYKQANRLINLMTLCRSCHMKIEFGGNRFECSQTYERLVTETSNI